MGRHWSSKWRVGGAPGLLSLPWDRPSNDHGDKFQAYEQALTVVASAGEGGVIREGHRHMTVKGAQGPRMGSRELVSGGGSGWGHNGLRVRLRGPLTTLELWAMLFLMEFWNNVAIGLG